MKSRNKALLYAAGAACGLASLVWATPNLGLSFTNVFGTASKDLRAHVRVQLPPGGNDNDDDNSWEVHFRTEGPSSFTWQDLTVAPQVGTTGWHSHPGMLFVTVASGTVSWYNARCRKTIYKTGDTFVENDKVHVARNEGTDPARLLITFVVPKGFNRRIDQAAPPCAVAAGIT